MNQKLESQPTTSSIHHRSAFNKARTKIGFKCNDGDWNAESSAYVYIGTKSPLVGFTINRWRRAHRYIAPAPADYITASITIDSFRAQIPPSGPNFFFLQLDYLAYKSVNDLADEMKGIGLGYKFDAIEKGCLDKILTALKAAYTNDVQTRKDSIWSVLSTAKRFPNVDLLLKDYKENPWIGPLMATHFKFGPIEGVVFEVCPTGRTIGSGSASCWTGIPPTHLHESEIAAITAVFDTVAGVYTDSSLQITKVIKACCDHLDSLPTTALLMEEKERKTATLTALPADPQLDGGHVVHTVLEDFVVQVPDSHVPSPRQASYMVVRAPTGAMLSIMLPKGATAGCCLLVLAPGSWGPLATAIVFDTINDGQVDTISITPAVDKKAVGSVNKTIYRHAQLVDMSNDGLFDTVAFDSNGDGFLDRKVGLNLGARDDS